MEVHDPPNHTRYCELVCPSAAGRIEFLSFSPATSLHKLNFRVADYSEHIDERFDLSSPTPIRQELGGLASPYQCVIRTAITQIAVR